MIKPPVELDSFARSKEPNFVLNLRNGHMGCSFDLQSGVGRKLTLLQNLALLPYSYCRFTISFCYGEKPGRPVRTPGDESWGTTFVRWNLDGALATPSNSQFAFNLGCSPC